MAAVTEKRVNSEVLGKWVAYSKWLFTEIRSGLCQIEGEGRCIEKNPLRDTDHLGGEASTIWTHGAPQEEQGCPGGSCLCSRGPTGARLDARESWKGMGTQWAL